MTISSDALSEVDSHWAVRALDRATWTSARDAAESRLVREALAGQLRFDPSGWAATDDEIERVATAYEVAAAEGVDVLLYGGTDLEDEQLRSRAHAGAFRAFELRRALPVPKDDDARVFHVLHLVLRQADHEG